MIETAIRDLLLADIGVAALVGSRRIHTGVMGQRAKFPLITLEKIDKLSDLTLDGTPGMNEVRITVECWDDDVEGVRALATAVNGDDSQANNGPLHGFSGPSGGETLRQVRLLVERKTDREPDVIPNKILYRVGADYMVRL